MHRPGEVLNPGGGFSLLGDFGEGFSGAVVTRNPRGEPGVGRQVVGWEVGAWHSWGSPLRL